MSSVFGKKLEDGRPKLEVKNFLVMLNGVKHLNHEINRAWLRFFTSFRMTQFGLLSSGFGLQTSL